MTCTLAGEVCCGTSTRTRTSPPLTSSGRGLETVTSASRPGGPLLDGPAACAALGAANRATAETAASHPRGRPRICILTQILLTRPLGPSDNGPYTGISPD